MKDITFNKLKLVNYFWKRDTTLSINSFWYLITENDMCIPFGMDTIESYETLKELIQTYLTKRGFDKEELSNG